ncbi:hypothetical protein EOD42_22530 [Rhodovarius crocodyli]|uniref:Methyltransferase FkbM domain-containing protein n=1 Tax=Rhodovarius crocodyli TaxID=1979269 RepID=A0A437M1J7_9PROT|nr:FkbM family methyltransferase [Rhodovarius crocodyli]RVT91435.1 hypothetical protein EOD42_22530 [Rhodovarius crocodyli]
MVQHYNYTPDFWHYFRGFLPSDIDLVVSLAPSKVEADARALTDYFGMRIHPSNEPSVAGRLGEVITKPPFPSDSWLAEAVEYVGLALALKHAHGGFTAVELGAGFAPWLGLSAILARRKGLGPVSITGVEGDAERAASMRNHLAYNRLLPHDAEMVGSYDGLSWDLRHAVIWDEDGDALFPTTGIADSGGQAIDTDKSASVDYRGADTAHVRVPAVTLETLLKDKSLIDFVHIDIQGAEFNVLNRSVGFVSERVKFMMVATHSRLLEGAIQSILFDNGWFLEREEVAHVVPRPNPPSIEALTWRDGGQVWRNLRFSEIGS